MESRDRKSDRKLNPKPEPQRSAPRKSPSSGPPLAADLEPPSISRDEAPILTPAPGRVTELRLAAADYVQRALADNCELDDSEESLAFVDYYIDRVRSGGKLSDEVLQLIAAALGVYLGEVVRTRFGGRWVALPPQPKPEADPATGSEQGDVASASKATTATPILDSIDDPVGWRLQLAAAPLLVDPIGCATSALQPPDDTGDDPVGFATTPALTVPLRAALMRLPPVSVDYYYSLTGRYETLAYMVELLAELEQRQRPVTEADSTAE